jgi:hypothetical protein
VLEFGVATFRAAADWSSDWPILTLPAGEFYCERTCKAKVLKTYFPKLLRHYEIALELLLRGKERKKEKILKRKDL